MITLAVIAALASSGKDRLYIESFNIAAGQTLQVPVLLLNDTAYSGLQTDLYLPEGLSLDMNDNDEYIIDLTSRRDKSHTVASRQLDDGAIRIYVTSVSTREFLGNSGAIMTLSITASSGFNGAAVIALRNSVCAEAIGTRHLLADEICEVNAGMKFDVNSDGEINIADINVITDIILGGTVDELTRRRADVNGDGEINIADINTVTDAILSK
jgi:hypothetical protein